MVTHRPRDATFITICGIPALAVEADGWSNVPTCLWCAGERRLDEFVTWSAYETIGRVSTYALNKIELP